MLGTGCSQEAINHLDILKQYCMVYIYPFIQPEETTDTQPCHHWFSHEMRLRKEVDDLSLTKSGYLLLIGGSKFLSWQNRSYARSKPEKQYNIRCECKISAVIYSFCGETSGCITKCQQFSFIEPCLPLDYRTKLIQSTVSSNSTLTANKTYQLLW